MLLFFNLFSLLSYLRIPEKFGICYSIRKVFSFYHKTGKRNLNGFPKISVRPYGFEMILLGFRIIAHSCLLGNLSVDSGMHMY